MKAKFKIDRTNPDAGRVIYERLKGAAGKEVAVGFPRGMANAYPDGTQVASVAAIHVFGTAEVPQRDFFALAKPELIKRTRKALQALKEGGLNQEQIEIAMNVAGQEAVSAIKGGINELMEPPLAPSTIAAKKSSKPLIDTEHMRDSVNYVIRKATK